jgi:hypothetical protein
MVALAERVDCFPHVRLAAGGGRPVEVALIAQLGIGAGDRLIRDAGDRQRHHAGFVDALDEPSVRLGAMSLAHGDASTLYSFVVGAGGHPFHRHAGDRTFTAVSGSGGTRLGFAPATAGSVTDPEGFVRALRFVTIPPDCLFTVRFGGGTWHRFETLRRDAGHPALFALSCHPNEFGGELAPEQRARVADNTADIPTLTEVLPDACVARLATVADADVPTIDLSLHEAPSSLLARACAVARGVVGGWRARFAGWRGVPGFRAPRVAWPAATELPANSLLADQLADAVEHTDCVQLTVPDELAFGRDDEALMAMLLQGFLANRPRAIGRMMALRNRLVAPWKLRTSPIGCPVSSLLAEGCPQRFADRFPVLASRRTPLPGRCEVLLGADDRHLSFRSVVGLRRGPDGRTVAWLATRVRPHNTFGRFYLAAIDATHRRYIAPTLLRAAVAHALQQATR